jgi:uncharacterized protein
MPGETDFPGVFVEEQQAGRTIQGVDTSVAVFAGRTASGPFNEPTLVISFAEFEREFGGLVAGLPLTYAVRDFFQNGGLKALIVRLRKIGGNDIEELDIPSYLGDEDEKTGIYAVLKADIFNLFCIPPDTQGGDVPPVVYHTALTLCVQRRAFLIVDPPAAWTGDAQTATAKALAGFDGLGLDEPAGRNGALYFPRVKEFDPLRNGEQGTFVPCGIVAGIIARTDASDGVWKAPAGIDAAINGISALDVALNEDQNGSLNPLGINCLRNFHGIGNVVWGARTLRGSDQLDDQYKYVPVRRLALFIEESLRRGLQWTVFEPNDAVLWAAIRQAVDNFMVGLFRQGAFQGATIAQSFFVSCDRSTTTQADIEAGIVNVQIGFAPLRPAEFVIISLQQMAMQQPD